MKITYPTESLYCRYPSQLEPQPVQLCYDPRDGGELYLRTYPHIGSGDSPDYWMGIITTWTLPGCPTLSFAKEILDGAAPLIFAKELLNGAVPLICGVSGGAFDPVQLYIDDLDMSDPADREQVYDDDASGW